jgi:osmoprotectant transport system ATP-binding protein
MLEIRNVCKTFGKRSESPFALDHVTLTLEEKKTHILLGSSGSGKSTLLRAILGLIRFEEGDILFEGTSVREMSAETRAKRMGYVPQEGGLFPHLTGLQNASLVARSLGWSREQIQKRTDELIPVVSLEKSILARYPREMSGGQRQRVAVLRAAFLNPDLLIFDEPLGALDPLVRADLQKELKQTFQRLAKTVVFVTHDIHEAAYLGNHLVLMHEGKVVQEGQWKDLRDRPATPFVKRFFHAQQLFNEDA